MKSVWKETLLPQRQFDPKTGRWFTISDADIRDAHRNIRRMVQKGLKIPLVWEHQNVEEADPDEWKANYARNTFGFVGGARFSTVADVEAGVASRAGTLLVRHDVHDENDVRQLGRIGGVSPKIYRGYFDSQGEEYRGLTVAHCAATPTPLQWNQAPFSAELSDSEALCLAYAPPDDDSETEKCPRYRETVDDWFEALDLSATAAPDEDSAVADEAPKKTDTPAGGGKKTLADVIKALRDAGWAIPDEVEDESGLIIAIKAGKGGATPEPDTDDAATPDEETAAAGGAPMVMSTLDSNPERKKEATAYAKEFRDEATARIEAALKTGRLNPTEARKLRQRAKSYEMSFTDFEQTGERWNKLLADIEAAEKKAEHSAWKPTGQQAVELSSTEPVKPPEELNTAAAGVTEAAAVMEASSKRMSVAK
jgi:hypothetical protein